MIQLHSLLPSAAQMINGPIQTRSVKPGLDVIRNFGPLASLCLNPTSMGGKDREGTCKLGTSCPGTGLKWNGKKLGNCPGMEHEIARPWTQFERARPGVELEIPERD